MDTSARLPRWKRDAFRRSRWHHLAYCVFHIISIPLNCSDTALRVATTGAKVIILVFRYASRKPGWNFSYEAEAKFIPVTGPAQSTGLMWRGPGRVFHRIAPWNFMWDKFWPSVCAAQSRHSQRKKRKCYPKQSKYWAELDTVFRKEGLVCERQARIKLKQKNIKENKTFTEIYLTVMLCYVWPRFWRLYPASKWRWKNMVYFHKNREKKSVLSTKYSVVLTSAWDRTVISKRSKCNNIVTRP